MHLIYTASLLPIPQLGKIHEFSVHGKTVYITSEEQHELNAAFAISFVGVALAGWVEVYKQPFSRRRDQETGDGGGSSARPGLATVDAKRLRLSARLRSPPSPHPRRRALSRPRQQLNQRALDFRLARVRLRVSLFDLEVVPIGGSVWITLADRSLLAYLN